MDESMNGPDEAGCRTLCLSEYLDGALPSAEADELRAHLEGCIDCQGVLLDLQAIRGRARSLTALEPERDLWPGVLAALDARQVIDLNKRRAGGSSGDQTREGARRRGVFLSVPQLSAAATILITLTGATVWALGGGGALSSGADVPTSPPTTAIDASVAAQRTSFQGVRMGGYSDQVEQLESILGRGRESLEPNTLRVLEKNLALIDRAISESVAALALDPGNLFVEEYLRRSYERKVSYLREATSLLDLAD